jgi:hypothetical membrane protein
MSSTTGRERLVRLAGTLSAAAGAGILMGIITAEALYPAAYRTAENEISDLGATRPPDSVSYLPSAAIFDVTMIVTGALVVAAAWLVHRALAHRAAAVSLACFGLGLAGVGVFPGNTAPHPYVALFVFLAAGVAALVVAGTTSGPFRSVSRVLGTVTLASTVLGFLAMGWAPVAALGVGGIERWIAYPAVLWLVVFGGYLMGSATQRPDPVRATGHADEQPAVGRAHGEPAPPPRPAVRA